MKMKKKVIFSSFFLLCLSSIMLFSQTPNLLGGEGSERFLEIWNELHNPRNGYFSQEGAPYHSIETALCETPDYGHETTSEAYSYYIWLEAMYGRVTRDWSYLKRAWDTLEKQSIPTQQTGNNNYNPQSPATYAAEWDLPTDYPSELNFNLPVGIDPISQGLLQAYGPDIYGMHWLFDCDDWYQFGTGQKPVYINTFQRGPQESVWETIPHPSIDKFSKGGVNNQGYLPLFTLDQSYSRQWRYINAPAADARVIQAMYWANQAYTDQGQPNIGYDFNLYVFKSKKMGDFLRLAFFDKYFKTIGENTTENTGGNGYDSCHYLLSWYYAWGGGIDANWAWRSGCSHVHFGYQNPMAAWILSGQSHAGPDFAGDAPNATQDWATSLNRQIELYGWLQSTEGLFSGGVTNSWKGRYAPYPEGSAVFNHMVYDPNPVYQDPGSGTWFGWQAWSAERLAEYYYCTGDTRAGSLLKDWAEYCVNNINVSPGDFRIPVTLAFSGQPGSSLHVAIKAYNKDAGIAACLARGLMYYARKAEDPRVGRKAVDLLNAIWAYRDDKGVSTPEEKSDYSRFLNQAVYVPQGMNGNMATGDQIQSGATFLSLRSKYYQDPMFSDVILPELQAGRAPVINYHRFWAQVDIALAMLVADELGYMSRAGSPAPTPLSVTSTPPGATSTPPVTVPGLIYFDANSYQTKPDSMLTTPVMANNDNGTPIGTYAITITYDPTRLTFLRAGDNGFGMAPLVNSMTPGSLILTAFNATGSTGSGLAAIDWQTGSGPGSITLAIRVNEFTDINYNSIGTAGGNATVIISDSILGDVNGDLSVNIVDALMVAVYGVGLNVSLNTAVADVNCDGLINIIDALMIAQFAAGMITQFLCATVIR